MSISTNFQEAVMSRIIVHIRGGVFQGAVADSVGTQIMVVDHDDIVAGDELPTTFHPIPVDPSEFVIDTGNTSS